MFFNKLKYFEGQTVYNKPNFNFALTKKKSTKMCFSVGIDAGANASDVSVSGDI